MSYTKKGPQWVRNEAAMEEQKIKQDGICIGANIRRLRLEKRMGQTELVRLVQLEGIRLKHCNLSTIPKKGEQNQAP